MLLYSIGASAHPRIKHVVVLYQENRGLDHFFGHHKGLKVDGLKGDESNPISLKFPEIGSVRVFDGGGCSDIRTPSLPPSRQEVPPAAAPDLVSEGWRSNSSGGASTNPPPMNPVNSSGDTAPYVATSHPQHGYAPYQRKLDIVDGKPRMDGFVE